MTDDTDLSGRRISDLDLRGARLRGLQLAGADLRGADLTGMRMSGVEVVDVAIDGAVSGLRVNGVDVTAYVLEQMDVADPERALTRAADAEGFRASWARLEELWEGTTARALALPEETLHASVDEEWSFLQTLRHLTFAIDAWLGRCVLGETDPFDPLDLPFDDAPPGVGDRWQRDARPPVAEVLELRRDRQRRVRAYLATLTDEALAADTPATTGPGWPSAGQSFPVRQCLLILLSEEYEHRRFAERDLAVLETSGG